ncbi:MAG: type II secretion system protein J [Chthoniobacteraceae bacterium]
MPNLRVTDTSPKRRRGAKQSGFSLIEVLVATTILALIVAMLGTIVGTVGSYFRATSGRSECALSARAIADYIQTDLKAALLPLYPDDTSNRSLQFVLNPAAFTESYKNGDALFWQAPVANDTTYGDIAEVGYFVKWLTGTSSPVPVLCRFFVEPAAPSATSYYNIYKSPDNWLNQTTVDAVAPATSDRYFAGLFSENVVAIWFRCLDGQGSVYKGRAFDSRNGAQDSSGKLQRLPSAVQVSFVVLDSRTAARLTAAIMTDLITLSGSVADEIDNNKDGSSDATLSPAEQFVSEAMAKPRLKSIAHGLKAHTTAVSLINAR